MRTSLVLVPTPDAPQSSSPLLQNDRTSTTSAHRYVPAPARLRTGSPTALELILVVLLSRHWEQPERPHLPWELPWQAGSPRYSVAPVHLATLKLIRSVDDFEQIIGRARQAGVVAQVLTGDCLKGAREVIALSKQYRSSTDSSPGPSSSSDIYCLAGLFATVGCHPCRADEFDAYSEGPEAYLAALAKEVEANIGVVVAIGECGLGAYVPRSRRSQIDPGATQTMTASGCAVRKHS